MEPGAVQESSAQESKWNGPFRVDFRSRGACVLSRALTNLSEMAYSLRFFGLAFLRAPPESVGRNPVIAWRIVVTVGRGLPVWFL